MNERFFGTVKFYNVGKGFGFIARDDAAPDVFVGSRALEIVGPLREGDRVSFEIERDRGGQLRAAAVELVD